MWYNWFCFKIPDLILNVSMSITVKHPDQGSCQRLDGSSEGESLSLAGDNYRWLFSNYNFQDNYTIIISNDYFQDHCRTYVGVFELTRAG